MKSETGYLAASVAGAVNTFNAYRPLARTGVASVPAFATGVCTEELPLQTILWQAAATAAFARRGVLRTPSGWLGLAVTSASWVGLAGLQREAARSQEVLERALVAGLGPDYRRRIAGTASRRRRRSRRQNGRQESSVGRPRPPSPCGSWRFPPAAPGDATGA
jgi:hypothetical protein